MQSLHNTSNEALGRLMLQNIAMAEALRAANIALPQPPYDRPVIDLPRSAYSFIAASETGAFRGRK